MASLTAGIDGRTASRIMQPWADVAEDDAKGADRELPEARAHREIPALDADGTGADCGWRRMTRQTSSQGLSYVGL